MLNRRYLRDIRVLPQWVRPLSSPLSPSEASPGIFKSLVRGIDLFVLLLNNGRISGSGNRRVRPRVGFLKHEGSGAGFITHWIS